MLPSYFHKVLLVMVEIAGANVVLARMGHDSQRRES